MSLFSALNTAVSGLTAQSDAFGNISDNVANSQTVGFKRVDTSFEDYLTTSTAIQNDPGSVVAAPDYRNTVQGTVTQSDNPLAMAITGQGFFQVSEPAGSSGSQPVFQSQAYFSRAGDFQMDRNGYLVNSAGQYLNGWPVNAATGAVDQTQLAPIQVSQSAYNPVATTQLSLSANLPATPTPGAPVSSQVDIYDSLGTAHAVTLDWTQVSANDWTVAVKVPDDIGAAARGTAEVKFGSAVSGNPVPDGTVGSIGSATGSVSTSGFVSGSPATLTFNTDFGNGPQTVTLDLGTYGASTGLTQYAGTSYTLNGLTQNGVPPGSFSSVTTQASGDVVINYNNGQSRTIAQVPVVTFADANQLQRQNGQAFTATQGSGAPLANSAGSNGSGALAVQSVESSNVDIATEFTQLIVAQRAYSANAKMVTTGDELLQTTLDMKR